MDFGTIVSSVVACVMLAPVAVFSVRICQAIWHDLRP